MKTTHSHNRFLVVWDNNVCHEYWFVYHGQGNVAQNIWEGANPPGPPWPALRAAAAASSGLVLGAVPAVPVSVAG